MKALGPLFSWLSAPIARRNAKVVAWLFGVFVLLVVAFSVIFHFVMQSEGRNYSWITGVYWTMTVMSTLGFGDVTFDSDLGRAFSIVVLVSGALFILVLLPFAFIQFVFMSWMKAREASRAPRRLPPHTSGHIICTSLGPVSETVITWARNADVPYVLVVAELSDALDLYDKGYRVMIGPLDAPDTYRAACVDAAALVLTTQPDTTNTNIAFTVREITGDVPVIATASSQASADILTLAGCDTVLQMGERLGDALASRVLGDDRRAHVIGTFDSLRVAQAEVGGGPLVGRTVAQADLSGSCGVAIAGMSHRGTFVPPDDDAVIGASDVLLLAGTDDDLDAYDRAYGVERRTTDSVVIIGGGRVGRATAAKLTAAGATVTIIEKRPERVRETWRYVVGDAAERSVLDDAGLDAAAAVIVTTHDDDVNVYLTIYVRCLRADVQIIARANADRNVATLNRAGADAVLSYASIGASAVWNVLGSDDPLVLVDGCEMLRMRVPPSLAGRSLRTADVRSRTGCNIVAIFADGNATTRLDADTTLPADGELLVVGETAALARFHSRFPPPRQHRLGTRTVKKQVTPSAKTAAATT